MKYSILHSCKVAFRALFIFTIVGFWAESVAHGKSEDSEDSIRSKVALITIKGPIMGGVSEYFTQAIEQAEQEKHECLVVELDTPGGGLEDTQVIVKRMLSSRVPIVVYVTPKGAQAASAGTFITMAAHIASMAPGTRIGAAHPISISLIPDFSKHDDDDNKEKTQKKQQEIMNEKVTNDTVSFIRSIATERNRNVEWAEKAVRESLSVTASDAVEKNIVDLTSDTLSALLKNIHGRKVQINSKTSVTLNTHEPIIDKWEMSLKQQLLNGLANPNLLMLFFLIGLMGIAIEFYHPGLILPGVTGALCLLLAFISMHILPVNVGGIILILAGIGAMIAEMYIASYGLLGISGAILLLLGGILIVDPSIEPHYLDPNFHVDYSMLIPLVIITTGMFLCIGYFVVRTQRQKILTGNEGMIGLIGKARCEITPEQGKVFIQGEYWNAISETNIPRGAKVEVVRVENMLLYVKLKP